MKFSVFVNDMIVYIEIPKTKKKKFLEENSELLCLLSGLIYYFENEPEVNVKFTCY